MACAPSGWNEGNEIILTTFSFSSSSLMVSFFCGLGFSSFAGLMVIWGCGQAQRGLGQQLHQTRVQLHSAVSVKDTVTPSPPLLSKRKSRWDQQSCFFFRENRLMERQELPGKGAGRTFWWSGLQQNLILNTEVQGEFLKPQRLGASTNYLWVTLKMQPAHTSETPWDNSHTSETPWDNSSLSHLNQTTVPFKDHIYETDLISHTTKEALFHLQLAEQFCTSEEHGKETLINQTDNTSSLPPKNLNWRRASTCSTLHVVAWIWQSNWLPSVEANAHLLIQDGVDGRVGHIHRQSFGRQGQGAWLGDQWSHGSSLGWAGQHGRRVGFEHKVFLRPQAKLLLAIQQTTLKTQERWTYVIKILQAKAFLIHQQVLTIDQAQSQCHVQAHKHKHQNKTIWQGKSVCSQN